MAYQNVGNPRFYINTKELAAAVGAEGSLKDIYRTLPVKQELISDLVNNGKFFFTNLVGYSDQSFVFYLGHTLSGSNLYIEDEWGVEWTSNFNTEPDSDVTYHGFSYSTFKYEPVGAHPTLEIRVNNVDRVIGSMVIGTYYDMPNAPNLSLTMSREYGGTKEITSHNGSSFSNSMWSRQPMWGDLGAWELSAGTSSNQALARSGRRVWQLTFSYMDDGDLWGPNQSLAEAPWGIITEEQGWDINDIDSTHTTFNTNLLIDDNFYSQVWHKTLNGTLPFIFQPDKDDNTNFSIARFRDNTLKATQTAFNVYDISVTIEEAW